MITRNLFSYLARLALLLSAALLAQQAQAVPSFARQTGLACNVCHSVPPELTSFGRLFKLNGYTLTGIKQIQSGESGKNLSIDELPPLSAMVQVADTVTSKAQPGAQNGNVQFPAQLSLFYAGAISQNTGAFTQLTYTQGDDHFSMDNADIRYADHTQLWGEDTIYGLTLNNGPTIEDVWNSTSAWGFPWVSSEVAPGPSASTLLGGGISGAGSVAGLGAYAFWDGHLYGLVSLYRASPTANSQPISRAGFVDGFEPYWRVAYQWTGANTLEVGAYGTHAAVAQGFSGAGAFGMSDSYTDYAVDTQFEMPMGDNLLSLYGTYIHETQSLAASSAVGLSKPEDKLNTLNLNGRYHLDSSQAFGLGYFSTTGDSDPLMYTPNPVDGSATGSPDSNGWILQYTYLPRQNMQMVVQYTLYNKFNGASDNYDGSGRKASDNDTLFLMLWVLW
ncbi:MAG TPA: cytochrome C [Gammaproteobacteria bacterium]|nr:cytochrome C [Gammaproteobacteria bacterium]